MKTNLQQAYELGRTDAYKSILYKLSNPSKKILCYHGFIQLLGYVLIFLLILGFTKGIQEASASHEAFLNKFPTEHTIIGCYNAYTQEIWESTKCTGKGDHNITLPPRDQIKIWLEFYNESEVINRLALINFETNFRENVGNPYAYGYVQTLRKWKIAPDIRSQFTWLKKRQTEQKKEYVGTSKRCGYYWENNNEVDGYDAGEYGVLSCLYRYHFHSQKGTWYAVRGVETTKYYKWYMYGIGGPDMF